MTKTRTGVTSWLLLRRVSQNGLQAQTDLHHANCRAGEGFRPEGGPAL